MMKASLFISPLIGTVFTMCEFGLLFGAIFTWTSPVLPKLQNKTSDSPLSDAITDTEASWLSSLITIGACLGCWLFAFLANQIGRKWSLFICGVPIASSYLLMIVFPNLPMFLLARFVAGFTLGGGIMVNSTYLSEICSKSNRSVIYTIFGLSQSVGALLCYSIGPWINVTSLNIILAVFSIMSLLLTVLFCVESPYFYLMKDKNKLAIKCLKRFRSTSDNIEAEIVEMKAKIKEQRQGNIIDIIKTKAFLRSFITAYFLIVFQQLTGINCILMYSQTIFDLTGASLSSSVCSIILGAIQLLSGCMGPILISKLNVKTILITSGMGMAISETVLGAYCIWNENHTTTRSLAILPILTLMLFIFSYNFGIGPLCWGVLSEVFVTRIKTLAVSFGVFVYFVVGFFISQYFKAVVAGIGIGALFLMFAGCCVAVVIFVKCYVIETKGKSIEEIQDILNS